MARSLDTGCFLDLTNYQLEMLCAGNYGDTIAIRTRDDEFSLHLSFEFELLVTKGMNQCANKDSNLTHSSKHLLQHWHDISDVHAFPFCRS